MNLTPEQLRQNAAAMLAFADGKLVQAHLVSTDKFGWVGTTCPTWDFTECYYRPKPEPKTRAWSKPEDVPGPVCWIRSPKFTPDEYMVVAIHIGCLKLHQNSSLSWLDLPYWEYSTDRKTWHKCEVKE